MVCHSLVLYLFSIFTCFLTGSVEAIIGGVSLPGSSISYQVSVQIRGKGHVCGGGIIGQQFVLTAAHCVLNQTRHLRSKHLSILARTNDLYKTSRPAVTIQVEKVFFTREFHPTVQFNHGDIAVLKLKDPLHGLETEELQLPRNYQPPQSGAAIAGFGWNEYHKIDHQRVTSTDGQLRFTATRVLSDDECEQSYPRAAIQSDVHLCALMRILLNYGDQYGVCRGDTGSPLVSESQVIGILSIIPPHCDEREKPAVYTRVARYAGMIVNVMEHGCDAQMMELNAHLDEHKKSDQNNKCHVQ